MVKIDPAAFKKLFGIDFNEALVRYSKTVGEERRSVFKKLFTRSPVNVTIIPIVNVIGDNAAKELLSALSDGLLMAKKGAELDLQPLLNPDEGSDRLRRSFQGFLGKEDWKTLKLSLLIMELEDAGETGRAIQRKKTLVDRYGLRGKHIYNMCRSGFIDYLEARLAHLRFMFSGRKPKIVGDFAPVWEEWMSYCKIAVFVNEFVDYDHFRASLQERFGIHKMHEVFAFARGGSNCNRLRGWAEDYCDGHAGRALVDRENYTIGESKAIKLTFAAKEGRLGRQASRPVKKET